MKKSGYIIPGVLIVSLGLAFGAGAVMTQDLAKMSSDAKVLLENIGATEQHVLVIELKK